MGRVDDGVCSTFVCLCRNGTHDVGVEETRVEQLNQGLFLVSTGSGYLPAVTFWSQRQTTVRPAGCGVNQSRGVRREGMGVVPIETVRNGPDSCVLQNPVPLEINNYGLLYTGPPRGHSVPHTSFFSVPTRTRLLHLKPRVYRGEPLILPNTHPSPRPSGSPPHSHPFPPNQNVKSRGSRKVLRRRRTSTFVWGSKHRTLKPLFKDATKSTNTPPPPPKDRDMYDPEYRPIFDTLYTPDWMSGRPSS